MEVSYVSSGGARRGEATCPATCPAPRADVLIPERGIQVTLDIQETWEAGEMTAEAVNV